MKNSLAAILALSAAAAFAADETLTVIREGEPTYTVGSTTSTGAYAEARVRADPGYATPGEYLVPVVSVGVVPPVQIGSEAADVLGLRLGLPYASHNNVEGLDVALLATDTAGDLTGLQAAGFYNGVGHTVRGVQVAGFLNDAKGDVRGIQAAGLANRAGGFVEGLQMAGIANLGRDMPGLVGAQVAAFYNAANTMDGLQMGLLNYAGNIEGAQIGFINGADDVRGFQIGLFNATRRLHGVQIGLSNYIEQSGLQWFPIINACF